MQGRGRQTAQEQSWTDLLSKRGSYFIPLSLSFLICRTDKSRVEKKIKKYLTLRTYSKAVTIFIVSQEKTRRAPGGANRRPTGRRKCLAGVKSTPIAVPGCRRGSDEREVLLARWPGGNQWIRHPVVTLPWFTYVVLKREECFFFFFKAYFIIISDLQ